ncbi:hypothetical protein CDAR_444411 [Caerostris darwini]|uniref:Uncharacterized protein n=1 Tax=Caerostris darwini TaxID=1538125 RepID=A0AAV4X7T4_9ARAC|nr:hypothetical protein CDAR_444411 [Caerostris darwini]
MKSHAFPFDISDAYSDNQHITGYCYSTNVFIKKDLLNKQAPVRVAERRPCGSNTVGEESPQHTIPVHCDSPPNRNGKQQVTQQTKKLDKKKSIAFFHFFPPPLHLVKVVSGNTKKKSYGVFFRVQNLDPVFDGMDDPSFPDFELQDLTEGSHLPI